MVKHIILFLFFCNSVRAQLFTFKIRKVPELQHFVFADEFINHNLNKKTSINTLFPKRLYLQVYSNDTFIVRWSENKLKEANSQFDYLSRDSLTYVGKLVQQGEHGIKFTFPFENQIYNMFAMAEEPLVLKRNYDIGPPKKREARIEFYFFYNNKRITLADLPKKEVDNHPEIEKALNSSHRIKLGFFSNLLYKKKVSSDLPLNIVETFPVHFVLTNSKSCTKKLYWKGITTTRTLNLNDTAHYEKGKEWLDQLPDDVLVDIIGNDVVYYQSRRYVFIENDSLIFVSNLNRGCKVFNDSLKNLHSIPVAEFWDSRDGINNYLIKIEDKYWSWVSRYGCTVEWRVYSEKKIKKLFQKRPVELFKELIAIEPLNAILLNENCLE